MRPFQTLTRERSIHDPETSLQGAADELLLLEHHLADPRRHCADCHRKHARTVLALCKEAVQMGGGEQALSFVYGAQTVVDRLENLELCLSTARYLRKRIMKSTK